jgi:hypothetical protein
MLDSIAFSNVVGAGISLSGTDPDIIAIGVNSTDEFTVSSSGVTIGSGTRSPYFNEYGTWTPTLGDGTNNFTMSSQFGDYCRMGGLVFLNGRLSWSSKGSASGSIRLSMPFAKESSWNNSAIQFTFMDGISTSNVQIGAQFPGTTDYVNFYGSDTTTSFKAIDVLVVGDYDTSGQIHFNGFYRVE